jgi:hypothetical protein
VINRNAYIHYNSVTALTARRGHKVKLAKSPMHCTHHTDAHNVTERPIKLHNSSDKPSSLLDKGQCVAAAATNHVAQTAVFKRVRHRLHEVAARLLCTVVCKVAYGS